MNFMHRALLAFLGLLALPLICWSTDLEYEVKAEYLERFTRFIDWPADSHAGSAEGRFRLCVIGNNPFGSYLEDMTTEVKFKGKPAELNLIHDVREAQNCDLLFIAHPESQRLPEILKVTRDLPILTVSDTPGFANKGVLINFYNEGAKVRFEINQHAIKQSRLHVSSRLLGLARVVEGSQ
jgi:hypothetical protein